MDVWELNVEVWFEGVSGVVSWVCFGDMVMIDVNLFFWFFCNFCVIERVCFRYDNGEFYSFWGNFLWSMSNVGCCGGGFGVFMCEVCLKGFL